MLDDATNPVTHVNKSVVTNSGTIKIGQGGDIQGLASVTNSGTIELQGGTLNLDVNVANSANGSGGNIQVDCGAKLVLGTDSNPISLPPPRRRHRRQRHGQERRRARSHRRQHA